MGVSGSPPQETHLQINMLIRLSSLSRRYYNYQIKKDEMDGACFMHGENYKCIKKFAITNFLHIMHHPNFN
jgi:hypothetical protein